MRYLAKIIARMNALRRDAGAPILNPDRLSADEVAAVRRFIDAERSPDVEYIIWHTTKADTEANDRLLTAALAELDAIHHGDPRA